VCGAVVASNTAVTDSAGARRLGHASVGVSVAGVVVTVLVVIVAVAVVASTADPHDYSGGYLHCRYTYRGVCYRRRDYVGTYGSCDGARSSSGFCYYN